MIDALTSLASAPDEPARLAAAWGIPRLIFYGRTDSTQNVARALMDSGAAGWTLVAADYQTAGRGQHGRSWFSEPGVGLMFSLLLRPESVEEASLLPIRVGLAIAAAIGPFLTSGTRAQLKWPNDIMVGNGKAGGVLCESQIRNDGVSVIVGVGLNVHPFSLPVNHPSPIRPTFLDEHATTPLDRLDLLDAVIRSLRARLARGGDMLEDDEREEYARHDWLRGRILKEPVAGEVVGISSYGHLMVQIADGSLKSFVTGRVILAEN